MFIFRINDFDPEEDKFMAISRNYRGDLKSQETKATVQRLKKTQKVICRMVGLAERPPTLAH